MNPFTGGPRHPSTYRAEKRAKKKVIAKTQRKVTAIREKATRTGYSTHGVIRHSTTVVGGETTLFDGNGQIIGHAEEMKEIGA